MMKRVRNRVSKYFIFGNLKRPILPFQVNLLYWIAEHGDNVGDYLAKIVTGYVMEYYKVYNKIQCSTKKLVTIGSVLSFVGSGKTTVWGTGLMNENCISALRKNGREVILDIRCVRGPLTAMACRQHGFVVPDVFGDPALLLPLFYNPSSSGKKNKVCLIPHFSQLSKYEELCVGCVDIKILSPLTSDWKYFIQTIVNSEIVVSSSLHGLILSEAYGIPSVHLRDLPGNKDDFKYRDYFYSTGRESWAAAETLQEALALDANILSPDILKRMQNDLLKSFPKDIFKYK